MKDCGKRFVGGLFRAVRTLFERCQLFWALSLQHLPPLARTPHGGMMNVAWTVRILVSVCLGFVGWFRCWLECWIEYWLGRWREQLLRAWRARKNTYHQPWPAKAPARKFCSQAKPTWVRRETIRLKALMPQAGCRLIAHTFNRLHARRGACVSKSFVAGLVRQHRHEIEALRRNLKHRVPQNEACNRVWAMDMTGKQDLTGNTQHILGLIDHGSRALLELARLPNKCSFTLLGHLFIVFGRYGTPKALRTDNERVFTSRVFRWGLRLAGVRHQRTDLGSPWQNGRIERFFGTLKVSLDLIEIHYGTALDSLLGEFRFFYNELRPHQHLAGSTPAERWRGVDWRKEIAHEAEFVSLWDGMLTGYYLRR